MFKGVIMKQLRNIIYLLMSLSAVMHSSITYAQIDEQAMICDLWGEMSDNYFETFEILKQSGESDPIAWIKKSADYEIYHSQSAGGIMLRMIFNGIENNQDKQIVKDEVVSQCHLFPADAVDPGYEIDPVSDFK